MSRSEKKTKIRGTTTAKSEKENKQKANREYRRVVKQKIKSNESEIPGIRETSNVWSFDKDGKKYDSEMIDKDLRK
tara:strand:+ start:340 stop:567 length:228 start_codon:yes stop_codon:yes gene_type:complete